jgi:hypothetical protein
MNPLPRSFAPPDSRGGCPHVACCECSTWNIPKWERIDSAAVSGQEKVESCVVIATKVDMAREFRTGRENSSNPDSRPRADANLDHR